MYNSTGLSFNERVNGDGGDELASGCVEWKFITNTDL